MFCSSWLSAQLSGCSICIKSWPSRAVSCPVLSRANAFRQAVADVLSERLLLYSRHAVEEGNVLAEDRAEEDVARLVADALAHDGEADPAADTEACLDEAQVGVQ